MPYYVLATNRAAFYTETRSEIVARTECARFIAIDVMRRFEEPLSEFTIRDHEFLSLIRDCFHRGTFEDLVKARRECMTCIYRFDNATHPSKQEEDAREFDHDDVEQWFIEYIEKVGVVVEQQMEKTKQELAEATQALNEHERLVLERAEEAIEQAMQVIKRRR